MPTKIASRFLLVLALVIVVFVIQDGMPRAEMILRPTDGTSNSGENAAAVAARENDTARPDEVPDVEDAQPALPAPPLDAVSNSATDAHLSADEEHVTLHRAPEPSSLAILFGLAGFIILGRRARRIWAG